MREGKLSVSWGRGLVEKGGEKDRWAGCQKESARGGKASQRGGGKERKKIGQDEPGASPRHIGGVLLKKKEPSAGESPKDLWMLQTRGVALIGRGPLPLSSGGEWFCGSWGEGKAPV